MTYMNYVNKHTISNTQNRNGRSVDGSDSLAVLCILKWNFKTEVNKIKTHTILRKKELFLIRQYKNMLRLTGHLSFSNNEQTM